MRKALAKLGELATGLPLLRAVPLFLLLSATVGHAQPDCTLTLAQADQVYQFTDFEPTIGPIGQSTTVSLTGSWTTPPTPLGCEADNIALQGLAAGGGGNGVYNPNVTFSNIVQSLSPVQTTFTATVLLTATHAQVLYSFACVPGPLSTGQSCPNSSEIFGDITLCPYSVPAITSVSQSTWVAGQTYNVHVVPAPCPEPTITSVSPNVRFAGQTYSGVVITGTNFTTAAMSAATGCPVSTMFQSFLFSPTGVSVNSSTEMTFNWTVPAGAGTGAAEVQVVNELPFRVSNRSLVDVLGAPIITWASDPDGSNAAQTSNNPPYARIMNPNSDVTNPTSSAGAFSPSTTYPKWATYAFSGTHTCIPEGGK